MRRVYRLIGLCGTYGDERVDAACHRALDAEAIDVGVVARMLERALETDQAQAAADMPDNVIVGRFARDSHFATNTKGGQK